MKKEKIKYCKNCGSPLSDERAFCDNCGTRVKENGRWIEKAVYEKPAEKEEKPQKESTERDTQDMLLMGVAFFILFPIILVTPLVYIAPSINPEEYYEESENEADDDNDKAWALMSSDGKTTVAKISNPLGFEDVSTGYEKLSMRDSWFQNHKKPGIASLTYRNLYMSDERFPFNVYYRYYSSMTIDEYLSDYANTAFIKKDEDCSDIETGDITELTVNLCPAKYQSVSFVYDDTQMVSYSGCIQIGKKTIIAVEADSYDQTGDGNLTEEQFIKLMNAVTVGS